MTARVRFLVSALVAAAFVYWNPSLPAKAYADDDPIFPDGGALIPTDGGSAVVVDVGVHPCWNMAIRCEGAQSTRYVLTLDAGVPTSASALLDYDQFLDIPVNCTGASNVNLFPKRYLGLKTDDAGIPNCKVYHSPF